MTALLVNRFELDVISYSAPEVGTYCDHLQVRYLTITDMKELRISSVNLVKEKAGSVEHEYVSATVQDRDKRVAYICFERNRGDEYREARLARDRRLDYYGLTPRWPSSSSSFHLGNASYPFSIASLDSTKNTCRAQDVVSLAVDTLKHPFDTITRTLKCHRTTEPLYLYELAVLAKTLHNTSIEYKLFSRNCYWYAGVLFDLLEQRLKSKASLGQYRNGVWGKISIYKQESAKDLARVTEQFVRNLAAFEHGIHERESSLRRQKETERENVELKQEVQRLKNKKSIQDRLQASGSVTAQRQPLEALDFKEVEHRDNEVNQREKAVQRLVDEKIEEERRRADEERHWRREERRLKEEERRLKEEERRLREEEHLKKEEERRLKEMAEQRAAEAEKIIEEKDKQLKLMVERLEGIQPLLELLPTLPERYSVAGLSTA